LAYDEAITANQSISLSLQLNSLSAIFIILPLCCAYFSISKINMDINITSVDKEKDSFYKVLNCVESSTDSQITAG
jgi:hypothetical protein